MRAIDEIGIGVAGVEITWHTTDEGDVAEPAVDTTDAAGLSTITLRVSQRAGVHGVLATTRDLLARSFFVQVHAAPLAFLDITPAQLSMVSRQTAQLNALPTDSSGNRLDVRVKWGSSNDRAATVDSLGIVRARRAGTAMIYASATVPPFMVDSIPVAVREAVPAQLVVRPDRFGLVVGNGLRMTAMALDSAGRPIDAELISWTLSNSNLRIWFREVFADSTVIHLSSSTAGTTTVEVRIGALGHQSPIAIVDDPLVDQYDATTSYCYGGITFGTTGRWYQVAHEGGWEPHDSLATVRAEPGSMWRSAPFGECDRTYSSQPKPTISVAANELLYVPTRNGVLSLSGFNGEKRWFAPIGQVYGNVAISRQGILLAGRIGELVALDADDGSVLWRRAQPSDDRSPQAVIDDDRGVAYVTRWFMISAVDLRTGALKWEIPTRDFNSNAAIARNGTLYVGAVGRLYAISPNGVLLQTASFSGGVVGSPIIDAAGNVYVATYDRAVRAFTADLTPRWTYVHVPGGPGIMDSPVIDRDGVVYAGTGSELIAVKDGRLLWSRANTSSYSGHYWQVGPDGDLYATTSFSVFRIRTAGVDPQAQWPMTHRTPDRSARR